TYRSFPPEVVGYSQREYFYEAGRLAADGDAPARSRGLLAFGVAEAPAPDQRVAGAGPESGDFKLGTQMGEKLPDLTEVAARRNLQESAFFFPQLTSGEDGVVRMTFTMPEALTEWRFMG